MSCSLLCLLSLFSSKIVSLFEIWDLKQRGFKVSYADCLITIFQKVDAFCPKPYYIDSQIISIRTSVH